MWRNQQAYRQTANGKAKRRAQSARHRLRKNERRQQADVLPVLPTVFRWRCDLRIVTKSPEQNWRISTHSACRESECSRFRLSKRSSSLDEQADKRSATPHSQPPSTRLPNWEIS
jgi:hypothetical protein